MALMPTAKRRAGHPPAGLRPGEKVSDYQRTTIRLPPDVRATLHAIGFALGRPQWRVLIDAINAYVGEGSPLTVDEQAAVRRARRARSSQGKAGA